MSQPVSPIASPKAPTATSIFGDAVLDLSGLLGAVRRSLPWAALLVVVFTSITWYVSGQLVPVYQARATLLVDQSRTNVLGGIDSIYDPRFVRGGAMRTQIVMLESSSVLDETIDRLQLMEDPAVAEALANRTQLSQLRWFRQPPLALDPDNPGHRARVAGWLRSNLNIVERRGTTLLDITFQSHSRELAVRVANGIGEARIDNDLESRLGVAERAVDWLTSRIEGLRVNLRASEARLQEFREANGLVDISSSQDPTSDVISLSATRLQTLQAALLQEEQRANAARTALRQIESTSRERWAAITAVSNDATLGDLLTQRRGASNRVAELSQRYGRLHPNMIAARAELESVDESIDERAEQFIEDLRDQVQQALAARASVEQQIADAEVSVQGIQRAGYELRELERDVEANQRLYDMFAERLKETTQANFEESKIRFVEYARNASGPVFPQTTTYMLLSALFAMGLAFSLALIREQLSNTLRGIGDVEMKLRMPLLGAIPASDDLSDDGSARQLFLSGEHQPFAEAVRSVRTAVVLSSLDRPHRIITTTSSIPGEGKTTLCTNLALAFGQLERTILLDCDMRRPDLAREFGLRSGVGGISGVLAGTARLDESIMTLDSGIDVLPSGVVPPNPLELLSSQRFRAILEELSKHYDRILVDTAPVTAASDAMMLSSLSDAMIFVARFDSTPLPVVRRSLEVLQQVEAPLIGVVLNAFDRAKVSGYGSYDYYYSAYGQYGEARAAG